MTAAAKAPPASDRVRREWLARVEAEYRSAVLTQELTLWLMQAGVSPDLLHDGLRIARDELDHADLSMEVFSAAGGTGGPTLGRETLALPRDRAEPLEFDIARVTIDAFCLGETVAVPLFKHLRESCTVPVARKALDRILRDEVRHRDFGWTLLEWLLESSQGGPVRALIARELPVYFRRIRHSYAPVYDPRHEQIADDDRRWGLMPAAQYGRVVDRSFARDWEPRFAPLGIDAASAWALATR